MRVVPVRLDLRLGHGGVPVTRLVIVALMLGACGSMQPAPAPDGPLELDGAPPVDAGTDASPDACDKWACGLHECSQLTCDTLCCGAPDEPCYCFVNVGYNRCDVTDAERAALPGCADARLD